MSKTFFLHKVIYSIQIQPQPYPNSRKIHVFYKNKLLFSCCYKFSAAIFTKSNIWLDIIIILKIFISEIKITGNKRFWIFLPYPHWNVLCISCWILNTQWNNIFTIFRNIKCLCSSHVLTFLIIYSKIVFKGFPVFASQTTIIESYPLSAVIITSICAQ
jgi:hypothetical protein